MLISGSISFAIVCLCVYLSRAASPVWVAVVWSLPISLVITLATMTLHDTPLDRIFGIMLSSTISGLIFLAFLVVWLVVALFAFKSLGGVARVWGSFGVAFGVWVVLVALVVSLYSQSKTFRSALGK
jgi:hypothetical protein